MREKLIHVNHLNETFDFYANGIYVDDNDLRDFEWSVSTSNDKITGFTRGVVTKTIPFVFNVNKANAEEIKNEFYEHFEKDILSVTPGYFEINGYRFYCYLTKSVKTNYNKRRQYLELSVTVSSDDPAWIKKTVNTINFEQNNETSALHYPFKYSFIYANTANSALITNENVSNSDVLIRIYGACVNPLIKIGDNIYQINTELNYFEFAEIDTANRTITKYSIYGDQTNIFEKRNKEYNIFEKIPSGLLLVSANSTFKADIILSERRSEPRWI